MLALLVVYMKSELTQLRYYKIKYFSSFWNYADMGAMISAVIMIVLHITRSESEFATGAIATLFHIQVVVLCTSFQSNWSLRSYGICNIAGQFLSDIQTQFP